MTLTYRIVTAAVLLATVAPPASTAGKVELLRTRIVPSVAMAPAHVRVSAFVEPAAENRALDVVMDSEAYYSRSLIDLEGAGAARIHTVDLDAVPEGEYEVRVTLTGADGNIRAMVRDKVVVTR